MNLLIVESPNKIAKLKSFLDNNWIVAASVGHICDLPKDDLGIDLSTFDQTYKVSPGKANVVDNLKRLSQKTNSIFLASDPDREGEAISWHIARLLRLDIKKTKRVCFYSITRDEVLKAIGNPSTIDLNLVEAYKSRRAVDRIFGYQLSPEIQRFGMQSAGRCQTPCLHLVVKREEEISTFKPKKYYSLKAVYKEGFSSEYSVKDDKGDFKVTKIHSKEELEFITTKINYEHNHKVVNIKSYTEEKRPKPPFITSTIITDASAKFKFKPAKTSELLQSLFHKGHITYIRTDSVEISPEGLALARIIISTHFPELLPEEPINYSAKRNAQGAHECIRPTHADDSDELKGFSDELKLYTLIRNRFLASQCKPQVFKREDVLLTTDTSVFFLAKNRIETFPGFTKIYDESELDEKGEKDEEINNKELNLNNNSVCTVDRYESPEHETKPPSRFKLSTLTREIERLGLGRPSTYSSIVQIPLDRGYYEEDKKQFLTPTVKGVTCITLLKNTMPDVLLPEYTKDLEENLDAISEAKDTYHNFIKMWYADWKDMLLKSKKYFATFAHEHPDLDSKAEKPLDTPCPACGSAMVSKTGPYGPYAECTGCKKRISLKKPVVSKYPCPKCKEPMLELKGKFGKYYKCPSCGATVSAKLLKPPKAGKRKKWAGK